MKWTPPCCRGVANLSMLPRDEPLPTFKSHTRTMRFEGVAQRDVGREREHGGDPTKGDVCEVETSLLPLWEVAFRMLPRNRSPARLQIVCEYDAI